MHLRRLERLDLLVQLRALQQSQPWPAQQQAVAQESRQRGGAPLTAHGTRHRTPPASVPEGSRGKHASAHAGGKVPCAAAGQGVGSRQAAGQAAPLQRGDEPAVGAGQVAQHQVPAGCLPPPLPPAREPEGQHREGQHDSQPQEKTIRPDEGQDGIRALATCSAAALSSAKDASSASQPSAPGSTPHVTSVQGEAVADEPQRASKRTKLNPMRFLCKFQLHGQCRDPSCADLHLDSPPRVRRDTVADAASGGDEARAEQGGAPSEGRASGAEAAAERVGKCGEMDAEQHAGASQTERATAAGWQQREGGDRVLAEVDAVWPDFVSFTAMAGNLASRNLSSDSPVHASVPRGGSAAADSVALEAPGPFGQRRMEQDEMAEDADISRLEQEWRATTEERYFGAMAQLGAARRKTTQEPANIAAWLRLGQLLLQGGGGEGPTSIRQDLALNALSNGLDANASSLDLWFAYLEVLERKDADEAVEMLKVAVQKVPLALSLWHRLASAQPSVQLRLGVWQRAGQSAVEMLVSDKQHVDTTVRLARGWRPALAMWLQAQIARAATLTLALRPVEASRVLSRAACQLPLVLGINFVPYAWEGDRDGVQVVEGAQGGARRGVEWGVQEADKWRVALPVIETLCLLSVQVVSAGVELHGSWSRPDVLLGRTPSTCFWDGGAGAEWIVAAAAHSAHVSMQARCARHSPPWTYAAICLSSLTSRPNANDEARAQPQQSVGDQKAVAIEAVEHASNLWRRCVESARHVGTRCAESGVSAVLAEHYVTLMRRASPHRGACTARQRILASFRPGSRVTAMPQQCAHDVHAPTAQEDARVLVALVRDAVLMDSCLAASRNGPDSKELANEEGEWELDEEQEADDLQGGSKARDLIELQQLAHVMCNRRLSPQSERSQQLKHAAQTAELVYWTSRLTLTTSTSVAVSTASRSGSERAACSEVQESLDATRRGLVHVRALLASAGASEAGQHSTGAEIDCGAGRVSEPEQDVSADIAACLGCLLRQNADTSEPSKSSKEGREQEVDEQEDEIQEALCEDAAEEAMWWWWSRSIVWAVVLEWRMASLPRAPPRHLHDMPAQDADRLLAKVWFCLLPVLPLWQGTRSSCSTSISTIPCVFVHGGWGFGARLAQASVQLILSIRVSTW